jgi:hypothetical protein
MPDRRGIIELSKKVGYLNLYPKKQAIISVWKPETMIKEL